MVLSVGATIFICLVRVLGWITFKSVCFWNWRENKTKFQSVFVVKYYFILCKHFLRSTMEGVRKKFTYLFKKNRSSQLHKLYINFWKRPTKMVVDRIFIIALMYLYHFAKITFITLFMHFFLLRNSYANAHQLILMSKRLYQIVMNLFCVK